MFNPPVAAAVGIDQSPFKALNSSLGSSVPPSTGALLLADEIDFALPSATMPLAWSRTYASYVSAEHGGPCGVLGHGWRQPLCDTRLTVQEQRTLLFDATGRCIVFPEALTPGAALHNPAEGIRLLRGGKAPSWHQEAAFRHIPLEWAQEPECIIVTGRDTSLFWRFAQPARQGPWILVEQRNRLGQRCNYHWQAAHPERAGSPLLLKELTDGAARRYRLHYLAIPPAREADAQTGWQADIGWRLLQVELLQADELCLNETSREAFEAAQAALQHPDLPHTQGLILVRYDYDEATDDLIRVRDHANTVTHEFCTYNHLMLSQRRRGGPLQRYRYDGVGPGARIIEQHNENGLSYFFTYHEGGGELQRTTLRDNLGREEVCHFEIIGGHNCPVKHTRADGSAVLRAYDNAGQLLSFTEPFGRQTRIERDLEGRIIELEEPASARQRDKYDPTGQLLEHERAGRQTRYQYDAYGRLERITHPDATQEERHYPEPTTMLPDRLIDPKGNTWHLQWSPAGQLLSLTDSAQQSTRYRYNLWGQLLSETNALDEITRYEYDHANQLTRISLPDGNHLHYAYDLKGRLIKADAPGDTQHCYRWDDNDQLIEHLDAAARRRRCLYDLAGRLVVLENENGVQARFEYDAMNRLVCETGFDKRVQRYRYNLLGQLMEKIEESLPARPITRYDYDAAGNLSACHLPANAGIPALSEYFEWDAYGQLTQAHGPGCKVAFEYDPCGRLIAETQIQQYPGAQPWQWGHRQELDEWGLRQRTHYTALPAVDWLSNGAGHLSAIRLGEAHIEIERDALHRETVRRACAGHTLFTHASAYTALGGFATRRLNIGERALEHKHYRYDPLGQLVEIDEYILSGKIQYTYDKANRLVGSRHGAQSFEYLFDAADNRIDPRASTESHDWRWTDNRIEQFNGIRNTFDAAGNLTAQTRPDGVTLKMCYDGANRLITLNRTNPDGTTLDAWYAYDPFSRRIAKGVIEGGAQKLTRYGWEGNKLVHEATEERLSTILYPPEDGTSSFAPVMRVEQTLEPSPPAPGALALSFFVTDHAGTPAKLINGESRIIWQAEPHDWAAVRNEQGVRQPIRFQGQWLDEESGFYYNRYRYYDPSQGRYITQDPIGLEGGINLYAYVGGSPIFDIDPLGLYDIIVNDTGGRNGATYGGTMTVTGNNGQSVTVPVSTWPNPTNPSPGIQPGSFVSTYSPTGHQQTRPGVRVNNGAYIPTMGPNPAQGGQPRANGINIHCGNSQTNRGSAGCITIAPSHCQQVWDVLQPGETGTVQINR